MSKKYNIVIADPPWIFSDSLTMSNVKRGAASQYKTLSIDDVKALPVSEIVEENALLALWVPSSLLQEGLDVMNAWGFAQKQTHIWVKTKKVPLKEAIKSLSKTTSIKEAVQYLSTFKVSSVLGFGMGRLFRQAHEVCLIGTRGKIYNYLKNKSQRSVHFAPVLKHSAKPENIQDMLDIMFSDMKKIEFFARRERSGWDCVGDEAPATIGQDIRDTLRDIIDGKFS